ncbi:MAG: UDP-N-acetylglucosamine acyltransferase [Francisellaceae bacterium]|jgi:UDP-N-acetylglucosamine acyltransferase
MIDPRAVIGDGAVIGDDVSIGAFSVISSQAKIGSGTKIGPHVIIDGKITIGENNKIFQYASVGAEPIDRSFHDEDSQTIIGDNNVIREFATIHSGTAKDRGITEIGNNNFIMNYVHIGHDCRVGSNINIVNYAGLAGHVVVDDYVTIGVYCGIHQFAHIGAHSFIAHSTLIGRDVPPYIIITGGLKATPLCVNAEGLKRCGFSAKSISNIRLAYKLLYRNGLKLSDAIEEIKSLPEEKNELDVFIKFLENSERGIIR